MQYPPDFVAPAMDTEIMSALHWKDDEFYSQHSSRAKLRDAVIERIDWKGLCRYASSKNSGRPCTLLDQSTMGGAHLIRILGFEDTRWIARVQLEPSTPLTASLLRAEVDAMELARARTNIPIPRVFGYELDYRNSTRAAFILMEFLPGPSAMDAEGGYEVHQGQIPPARKDSFYMEVAGIQVEMASIRLPKIGSIIRRDGSFDIGPFPGLGGPFSTATDFFRAWAERAAFPLSDLNIRKLMTDGPVEGIISSINSFPHRLQELACKLSAKDNGPFPLYHRDFFQSNIIVDDRFRVLGVIDWEGASTVPWELVEPPLFLGTVPPAMDDPNN